MSRDSTDVGKESVGARAWVEALEEVTPLVLKGGQGSKQNDTTTLPLVQNDITRMMGSETAGGFPALNLLQAALLGRASLTPTPACSGGWYLRNLTTQELVQLCKCGGEPHVYLQPHDLRQGTGQRTVGGNKSLDDLLLRSTQWTRQRRKYEEDSPANGPWSGHRFDIVSRVKHEKEYPSVIVEGVVTRENGKRMKTSRESKAEGDAGLWRDVTGRVLF